MAIEENIEAKQPLTTKTRKSIMIAIVIFLFLVIGFSTFFYNKTQSRALTDRIREQQVKIQKLEMDLAVATEEAKRQQSLAKANAVEARRQVQLCEEAMKKKK